MDYGFYDLLMKREYAEQIVSGEKKIEIRACSDYYDSRFLEEDETGELIRKKGKNALHFHNYNNSWFLDVEIEEFGEFDLTSDNIKHFQAKGISDFDDLLDEVLGDEKNGIEPQSFFYFVLGAVINTNI